FALADAVAFSPVLKQGQETASAQHDAHFHATGWREGSLQHRVVFRFDNKLGAFWYSRRRWCGRSWRSAVRGRWRQVEDEPTAGIRRGLRQYPAVGEAR